MINLPTGTRHNSCRACTFIVHGVKTRIAIPHTCGKTDQEIMKIIKKGKTKLEINPPVRKTCYKCQCVFEYVESDVNSDPTGREGSWVVCPNMDCKSFIAV